MSPEELLTLSKEELVGKLDKLNIDNEQIMAEMVMIRSEILARFEEEKKDGEIVGEYSLTKSKRVTFRTSLEQAEELGATKKAVDTAKLKTLYNKGVEVPGTQETIYLSVRRLQQKDE